MSECYRLNAMLIVRQPIFVNSEMQGTGFYTKLENLKDQQEVMFTGQKWVWDAIKFYCCSVKIITLLPSDRVAYVEQVFLLQAEMKVLYLVIHVTCFAHVLNLWYLIALLLGRFLSSSSFSFSFIMETLLLAQVQLVQHEFNSF